MQDLVNRYLEDNNIRSFEGERGVRNLEQLVGTLGYGKGFMCNRAIEEFLTDNSGAIDAIVNFIAEWTERNTEWQESLKDACASSEEAVSEDETVDKDLLCEGVLINR